jgi:hypothetical protein
MKITLAVLAVVALVALTMLPAWRARARRILAKFSNKALSAITAFRLGGSTCFANIAEGEHEGGLVTFLAGPTPPTARYQLVIKGADSAHVIIGAAATEKPVGVAYDISNATDDPIQVAVLGGASDKTLKVLVTATVALGTLLQSAGDGSAKVWTTAGFCIGMCLQDGVTGDVVEFTPTVPCTVGP